MCFSKKIMQVLSFIFTFNRHGSFIQSTMKSVLKLPLQVKVISTTISGDNKFVNFYVQIGGAQHSRAMSTDVRKVVQRPTADLPGMYNKHYSLDR